MVFVLFSSIFCVFVAFYLYVRSQYSYWAKRNVPFREPKFPFGNLKLIDRRDHASVHLAKIYNQYGDDRPPFVGTYYFLWPTVLATRLDFIQNVLVSDFQYFQERGRFYNEKHDSIGANLFNLEYDKWRPMRSITSPLFTSSKLKSIYPIMLNVVEESVSDLLKRTQRNGNVAIAEFLAPLQIDITSACALGIESKCLANPNSDFLKYSEKVMNPKLVEELSCAIVMKFKNLARMLRVRTMRKDVSAFFTKLITDTVHIRETNNVKRSDFIGHLIKLKNNRTGDVTSDGALTMEQVTAEGFAIFMGGTKTTTAIIAALLLELAQPKNKHIQDQARDEINAVLEKYDGNLTFDALNEMSYVDAIVRESMRKYPAIPFLPRLTTKDYVCPLTNVKIPKDMTVMIPIYGVHHDPQIYPNPDEFRPERFLGDELKARPPIAFLPFGAGPRNCVCFRLGLLQVRCCAAVLLRKFHFTTCDETIPLPIPFHPWKMTLVPEHPIVLNVRKIDD